jgi:hypothetical protein
MTFWFQNRGNFFPTDKIHLSFTALFALIYLSWTSLFVGLRTDHVSFLFFIILMLVSHTFTRTLTYYFIFFILFWIIYDSMRVYPNYLFNEVNISEPYDIEKQLFGILTSNGILTPNEYFRANSHVIADFLSGIFYLTWVPVPLALGLYFFVNDKRSLLHFSGAFLFTNILGFMMYYAYPAAPPWYFDLYGDAERFNIPGNAAQLTRFDELIGYPLFNEMYTKNANVFAAIPSLHAAYPIVTWFFARKIKKQWLNIVLLIDIAGIWFSAVYSFHHYIIDVLLGMMCAVSGILLFEKWLLKTRFVTWMDRYVAFAEK